LQLQQLQHFQHLQLFADLHLQHFWQNVAYIQGLWHKFAVPPLLPFLPILTFSFLSFLLSPLPGTFYMAKSYKLSAKS
jgi:hypothetical protein